VPFYDDLGDDAPFDTSIGEYRRGKRARTLGCIKVRTIHSAPATSAQVALAVYEEPDQGQQQTAASTQGEDRRDDSNLPERSHGVRHPKRWPCAASPRRWYRRLDLQRDTRKRRRLASMEAPSRSKC